jgi:hypothetical protein
MLTVPGYPAACSMPGRLVSTGAGSAWPQMTALPGRATRLMGGVTAGFCLNLNRTRALSLQQASPDYTAPMS